MNTNNIVPDFSKQISRNKKESLLNQKSISIWLIGLSGSGKSTLASALEHHLFDMGFKTAWLDGDNVRIGINKDLGFTINDREENIRRIAEINKLFINNGIIVINSFVCPLESMRSNIISIIGNDDVIFIYTKASIETCIKRDVKGLYKKALQGEISQFTGISDIFEEPLRAHLVVDTEQNSFETNMNEIINFIIPKVSL
ncbi:MAG: adenylyl-sulfate kinase [Bacteroidales bacterium]|nr:adenylyl-sulfate kinase [Bacteroidales bacterium]